MNNCASDCWTILPETNEHSCQLLLKNYASDCWRVMLAGNEQFCQRLLHIILNCWIIVPVTGKEFIPVTVEELCQWLLKNYGSDCWRIVPHTVDELCQWLLNSHASCFFLFLTLEKSLPVFCVNISNVIDYFNSGSQLSKLEDYWLIIIFIFSLYMFYQPL